MQISWLRHGLRKSGKSMHLVKYGGSIMKYDGLIGEDSSEGDGSMTFLEITGSMAFEKSFYVLILFCKVYPLCLRVHHSVTFISLSC